MIWINLQYDWPHQNLYFPISK